MLKQFDHMIEPKLNLELSNVFPRLKFLAGCGQFSDFSNNTKKYRYSDISKISISSNLYL
jgi:hypothetical protein